MSGSRGSILILALWVLSVLGIFSLSISYGVRQKISLIERLDRRYQLYRLAELGVYRALAELKKEDKTENFDSLSESWSTDDPLFRSVSPNEDGAFSIVFSPPTAGGGVKMRYGMQDEESKINLNTASPQIISKLFEEVAHLDEEEANKIAYRIVDWRDPDNFYANPSYGAEDDDYEDLKPPYECKDHPFEVLNELLLVKGMTREVFEQVKGYVTIYGSGAVNIHTAPKEVLLALGLGEDAVKKILTFRAGTDGEEATPDDQAFTSTAAITTSLTGALSFSGSELVEVSNLVSAGTLTTASTVFMIRSRGELAAKRQALDIAAVAGRDGKIFSWSAGNPYPWQLETGE